MRASLLVLVMLMLLPVAGRAQESAEQGIEIGPHVFGAMRARGIGPAVMSGRISALDVVNSNPRIIYAGAASGGVWKSKNGGVNFRPVFDDHNQCIGSIAVDQAHPDTVWVGTGEVWVRNSVSVGDGLYRTYDGGDKWERVGLENTERIGEIIVHPTNSEVVYAAALGHLWNANEERGLYKTSDGGTTWDKILYVDENTGCHGSRQSGRFVRGHVAVPSQPGFFHFRRAGQRSVQERRRRRNLAAPGNWSSRR